MSDPRFSDDPRFVTFKQATKLKVGVRKGEKAAAYVVKMIEVGSDAANDGDATYE